MELFFFLFATVAIIAALGVVLSKNVVHSLLSLLVVFFCMASFFILLHAEFLAAIQIIVYAGAIMVLFLFTIFLVNVRTNRVKRQFHRQWPLVLMFSSFLLLEIFFVVSKMTLSSTIGDFTPDRISEIGNTTLVGSALFTRFVYPFELASLILLATMIGAIVLIKKENW
ncbi:MAG: NADH-quinone oxidoreductase subunit J [Nitrospirota bacterium]